MTQKKKLTLYLPEELLKETQEEADRHERSVSWLLQQAWLIARDQLRAKPGVPDIMPAPSADRTPRR